MIRKLFYVAIWLIGFLSLASCGPQYNHDMRLVRADSLMNEHPDSALLILENIDPLHLKNKANHAYYALLLTQARDKNFVVQTDDSLIQTAVRYYDGIKDNKMQAKAYYYWGSVYRDMNQCGEAIKKYLVAITYAKELEDKKLLGVLYNNIGYLYYTQNLDDKADSIYRQAEKLAIETKDSILLSEALFYQGKLYIQKDSCHYATAEEYMIKALEIANNLKNKNVQIGIVYSLSYLYNIMNQTEEAILYAKKHISLFEDTIHCYRAFLLLGDAYFKAGQYDSATIYFSKCSPSQSYSTKASAYMRLADIAQRQGNLSEALKMERLYSTYKDSFNILQQSHKILDAEKEMQLIEQQAYYQSYLNQYLYFFILLILIISTSIHLLRKRYKHKTRLLNQERLNLEQKKDTLNQLYSKLKAEITLKDEEIKRLKTEIASQQINQDKKQMLQIELDHLNKKREALAKEALEHSKVFSKMEQIVSDFKLKDDSEEKMNNEDWQQLLIETDLRWNGLISVLSAQYKFSSKELHLICLFLTDFPFANLEYISGISRRTLYRNKNKILSLIDTTTDSRFEGIIQKLRK